MKFLLLLLISFSSWLTFAQTIETTNQAGLQVLNMISNNPEGYQSFVKAHAAIPVFTGATFKEYPSEETTVDGTPVTTVRREYELSTYDLEGDIIYGTFKWYVKESYETWGHNESGSYSFQNVIKPRE